MSWGNLSSHIFKYKTKYELLHIFTDKNFLSLEVAHFTDSFLAESNFLHILPYKSFLSLTFTCNNM